MKNNLKEWRDNLKQIFKSSSFDVQDLDVEYFIKELLKQIFKEIEDPLYNNYIEYWAVVNTSEVIKKLKKDLGI